ncbi:protein PHYLLO, chloroplastic isoform X2 [Momordica charantia]|uniref:Protein PHYLLO, chloroplastic isoform X2 n=1 Tax=Momordica charantia TaxID=3673 RepID=A0A6J1D4P1_MOMCH|nr:protein PHYLLO, chloroplastic isoform X2 [Momordica charantia]
MKVDNLSLHKFALPHSVRHFIRGSFPRVQFFSTVALFPEASRLPGSFRVPQNHCFKGVRFDSKVMGAMELSDLEDGDLVVEMCITHTLPPALTLNQGLESISEAIEKLKLEPPRSSDGVFRFQVAVPPSSKALLWFCCQPESSEVFPVFFLSKEKVNATIKSLYLNDTRGVFGIGTAIPFASSSSTSSKQSSLKRYLTNDSAPIMAYGFVNENTGETSSPKHEAGHSYFCVPQIELNEYEGVSILSATLAWSESFPCTLEEALHSLSLSIYQISTNFPSREKCQSKFIRSSLTALKLVDRTHQMAYMEVLSMAGESFNTGIMEMKGSSLSHQFCIRLSSSVAVACNMWDHISETRHSEQEHANINALWASLIVEECSRLGLTYFCIAPGSRSSPLAVAAASHPLITCMACFDERSLSFHAIGYAKGSHRPAVVITSSGTAVSNLLPAVVEASQNFLPLLLLTADRPPELQDAGANQSINQVNHFGSFVRFFFGLPVPTDQIPARMVLTTLDSAVHRATSSPCGPVHINCPFREPLESSPSRWNLACLNGLHVWMSSAEAFTKYIQLRASQTSADTFGQMAEVLKVINGARNGILLLGSIHSEDEIWAAFLLAKHISWPIVADVLSGLRLRKSSSSFLEIEKNFFFVDHLDHALLSDSVRKWLKFDVIIQIGSRVTSKRVSKMLEDCFPCSYIMVDEHPGRHDPSHIVTHRIQSTVLEFVGCLLKTGFPRHRSKCSATLQALNMMVEWEIQFQISSNYSLSEPQVAQVISEALPFDSVLFLGNSMPIRDVDMYAHGWSKCNNSVAAKPLNLQLPFYWTWTSGNRGASGIDGLLSTAVGFSVGSNKRVLCVVGDVSFLYDTNGLAILSQRMTRKPVTIVVINNNGGGIFSLLPIKDKVEPAILDQYFHTSHKISLRSLCVAHGLKHLHVRTKRELQDALLMSQREENDFIIEVESSIDANTSFHSLMRKFSCQAADHGLSILSRLYSEESVSPGLFLCKISRMDYTLFRIPLCAPPTTTSSSIDQVGQKLYREGFILSLFLEDGSLGLGEVSPLDIHKENLLDVEEQLKCLIYVLKGAKISSFLPLLRGSFSSWICHELGIPPSSIYPSVRCGLEMAVLNAIAARRGCSLLDVLQHRLDEENNLASSSKVQICGLLDSGGSPSEVARAAKTLVEEGFTAIKLKVARQGNVMYDAAVVQEVRKKLGNEIELRVDANRNWSCEEAILFSSLVKDCGLQYIEEPVMDEDAIIKFSEESGLPVALDETIDRIQNDPVKELARYAHPGIVAIVIKPSVIGGFENAALVARWAQQLGKMAVVSAAFESGVGLSGYIQLSCYLELQNAEIRKLMNNQPAPSIAHGLGTYRWLEEDVTVNPLRICRDPHSGIMEASVAEANQLLKSFQINQKFVSRKFTEEQVRRYQLTVDSKGFSHLIKVLEVGQKTNDNVLLFLHGFLGTGEDWITTMKAISGSARCISLDLPGHGGSTTENNDSDAHVVKEPSFSMEVVADILYKLIHHLAPGKVNLVGYSMGARIAMYMALRFGDKIGRTVIISGSPGLEDEVARRIRRAKDDSRARILKDYGLQSFLEECLREHPHYTQILASRLKHDDVQSLAKVLSDLSIGRQPQLWDELEGCKTPLSIIVGENDTKFKKIAQKILSKMDVSRKIRDGAVVELHEIVEIPDSGHAAHLENPLAVINALSRFLIRRTQFSSNSDSAGQDAISHDSQPV